MSVIFRAWLRMTLAASPHVPELDVNAEHVYGRDLGPIVAEEPGDRVPKTKAKTKARER